MVIRGPNGTAKTCGYFEKRQFALLMHGKHLPETASVCENLIAHFDLAESYPSARRQYRLCCAYGLGKPGGTLIRSLFICPKCTASKCSAIALIAQPSTNG